MPVHWDKITHDSIIEWSKHLQSLAPNKDDMNFLHLVELYFADEDEFDACCNKLAPVPQQSLRATVEQVCRAHKNKLKSAPETHPVTLRIMTDKIINVVKRDWEQKNGTVTTSCPDTAREIQLQYTRGHQGKKEKLAQPYLTTKKPMLIGDTPPHGLDENQNKRYDLYLFFRTNAYVDPRDLVRCTWFKTCGESGSKHEWAVCAHMIISTSAGASAEAYSFVLGAYRANAIDGPVSARKDLFRGLSMNLDEYIGYTESMATQFWMDYVLNGAAFPGLEALVGIHNTMFPPRPDGVEQVCHFAWFFDHTPERQ